MAPINYLSSLHPRSLKYLSSSLAGHIEDRLWLKVLIGMVAGLIVGVLLGPEVGLVPARVAAPVGTWLAFPGQLFLAAIQMIVVPLVFASIILGLAASENQQQMRILGIYAATFFMGMTIIAALLGLLLATWIEPGAALAGQLAAEVVTAPEVNAAPVENVVANAVNGILDLPVRAVGLLPGNPLGSLVAGEMLQIVIFSAIVGIALVSLTPSQSKPLLDLLSSLQQVCMTIVKWAMRLAPFAVFGLMARLTSQLGFSALIGMAQYVATVAFGLVLLLILYVGIVRFGASIGVRRFLSQVRELLLLAFSTSSSASVMPLSIRVAEDKLEVAPSVAQFVIPLGATINMNGTAMYQSVAAVFLAQVYGIEISAAGLAFVVSMAIGASIGSPGTPGVGIVILSSTLATIGIPSEGIALVMGVDRILDMGRTSVNVAGDLVACSVIDRRLKRKALDSEIAVTDAATPG